MNATRSADSPPAKPQLLSELEHTSNFNEVLKWLDHILNLLQPTTREGTLQIAVRAVVDDLGFAKALVVTRKGDSWDVVACHPSASSAMNFDYELVNEAFWKAQVSFQNDGNTLKAAAPLKDSAGKVIEVLYGEGQIETEKGEKKAALLGLLARVAAATLTQSEISRLTQYMSVEQANEVQRLAETWEQFQEMYVTVLFCDIRDFTRISGDIQDLKQMVEWVREVLGMVLDCVRAHQGTLVDYTGDGLFALWGAPAAMQDHAKKAYQAALEILRRLESFNAKWESLISHKTRVGIGLHSGVVRIGNVGTRDMPKFGAQGKVVNVGSRIESRCKFFRCQALMSQKTYDSLMDPNLPVRRLATICPPGVEDHESFNVYELALPGSDTPRWKEVYEKALHAYEKENAERIRTAAMTLAQWRDKHPDDLSALVLLRAIIDLALTETPPDRHPVWVFKDK